MAELTWEEILTHLKYEESLCLKIYNSNDYNKDKKKELSPDDLYRLKQLRHDATLKIYRNLSSKKDLLKTPLSKVEGAVYTVQTSRSYDSGSLKILLKLIRDAITIVESHINVPYFIHEFIYTKDSVKNNKYGFETNFNHTSKLESYKEVINIVQVEAVKQSESHSLRVFFVTDDSVETWPQKIILKCNLKQLFTAHFNSQYLYETQAWELLVSTAYKQLEKYSKEAGGEFKIYIKLIKNPGNTHSIMVSREEK